MSEFKEDRKVDREDEEGLDEILGIELTERMKEKGLVVKEWVDQRGILGHKAAGRGAWNKWEGERLVKGEEIGEAIKEMVNNESLVMKAAQVKGAAMKAIGVGGEYEVTLKTLIEELKRNAKNI
ncbi:hypothetical protein RJT34_06901 [Clitoria ternatea]|uniref:Uncharacterized protein n=1 Tax=Clitoria ternatea TaxID=43366 RepID=A0AAN9K4R1_CLITE